MRFEHPSEDVQPTWRQRASSLLLQNLWFIVAAILAIGVGYIWLDHDLTLPRFWYVAGIASLPMLGWGYVLGEKIKGWIFEPNQVYVVDLDAREVEAGLWLFPQNDFLNLDVHGGEIDQVAPSLAFAKDVNPSEMTARGTWRGTLTDRELLTALHMIDVCRGQLEDDAKVGFAFKSVGWSIVRNAVIDTTLEVVNAFEDFSLPDKGDGLESAVTDALERYDVEEQFKKEAEELGADQDDLDEDDLNGELVDEKEASDDV